MASEAMIPFGRIDNGTGGGILLAGRRNALLWLACAFVMLLSVMLMAAHLPARRAYPARPMAGQIALDHSHPPPVFPMAPASPAQVLEQPEPIPIDKSALMVAAPYRTLLTGGDRLRARDCLAIAGWYEAGANAAGQEAIMQVVLNRVRHPSFPHSVCGVVFQGVERATGCQFTFTCDGSLSRRKPSEAALAAARWRAERMLGGNVQPEVGTATHYHADYVLPDWARQLVKVAVVDGQSFYRWPGYWGDRAAMVAQPAPREPAVPAIAWAGGDADATSPVELPRLSPKAILPALAATDLSDTVASEPQGRGIAFQTIALSSTVLPGRFAIDALESCKGRPSCVVAGWAGREATSGLTMQQLVSDPPDFLFLKRDRDRISSAYWNCAKYKRADASHCLPQSPAGIGALLRTGGWSA